MKIDSVELHHLQVPYKAPFETSFARMPHKDCLLVSVHGEGQTGYGESIAFPYPYYSEETTGTIHHMLVDFLIPALKGVDLHGPEDVSRILGGVRGNCMAISALEGAVWDWCAKLQGVPLARLLGGTRTEVASGVSIGIEPSIDHVLANVGAFLEQGYQKIKVKIKPGFDVALIAAIRGAFGHDFPLMADANSAYTLADAPLLRQLDEFGLLMIEQPLAHDDIIEHARLQEQIATPICLDESIHSPRDAANAIALGSCRIINIKIGRVGGITRAKQIHDLCMDAGIPVWCGGMLELGVGRAHNIAIASLPGFTIAGDTCASHRTFAQDIVNPVIDFSRPGFLAVPDGPGIGYAVDSEWVDRFAITHESFDLH